VTIYGAAYLRVLDLDEVMDGADAAPVPAESPIIFEKRR
jgi:hypothetical protein